MTVFKLLNIGLVENLKHFDELRLNLNSFLGMSHKKPKCA